MANLKRVTFRSLEDLKKHIKAGTPTLYFSSQTSTVIPFDKIDEFYKDIEGEVALGDLSQLPSHMELTEDFTLKVTGPVNWTEAKAYLNSKGRDQMTSPTEGTASILAGIATSCTGELAFGLGTIRDQLVSCKILDQNAEEKTLSRENTLEGDYKDYQKSFEKYKEFKNAPFPRLEEEIDLAVGMEGQLGVIIEGEFETIPLETYQYLFLQLPRWEENDKPHLEVLEKVQVFRDKVVACELLDWNSISYLKEPIGNEQDLITLQIKASAFEEVYTELISELELVDEQSIFEISEMKWQTMRVEIPRQVNEINSRKGIVKRGTDVQVRVADMAKLFKKYRDFSKSGIAYMLFGHFGDCHLHFNFLPTDEQQAKADDLLEDFYTELSHWICSPFAEHGIGFIKQKYISSYWSDVQGNAFRKLKAQYDSKQKFIPKGFLSV